MPAALAAALRSDDFKAAEREVKRLIKHGNNQDAMDRLLYTACAMSLGLDDHGQAPRSAEQDEGGDLLPLRYARLALDHGASPHLNETLSRETPLMHAVKSADCTNVMIARELLERGAKINSVHGRSTALSSAILGGNEVAVNFLLERGADPNLGSLPAWFYALHPGRAHCLPLLFESGADIKIKTNSARMDGERQNALHFWLTHVQEEQGKEVGLEERIVAFLGEKGLDIKAKCNGMTPKEIAVRNKFYLAERALAAHEAKLEAAAIEASTRQATTSGPSRRF